MFSLKNLRHLPGCSYGIQQSTLLVTAEMSPRKVMSFESFDGLLQDQFENIDFSKFGSDVNPRSIARRLMFTHIFIQREQKIPVFGDGRILQMKPIDVSGRVQVVFALPCVDPQASWLALDWVTMAMGQLMEQTCDVQTHSKVLEDLKICQSKLLAYALQGTNAMHFLQAAHDLKIPYGHLLNDTYALGIGSRMHWLKSSITDQTSHIGVGLAHRKQWTAAVLRRHGIPVPHHQRVNDLAQAHSVASKMGYPVVIKPDDQEQGLGVFAGLKSSESLEAAYRQACKFSKYILVEKHHEGQDYRLTVFRGQVVKVLLRTPGSVVGDGIHSVRQLVSMEQNAEHHRRRVRQGGQIALALDEEALGLLSERGYSAETIPAEGEKLILRRKSNISAGGVQHLVPIEHIHPDNLDLAIRACESLRLDLCGVDFITPDISKSWLDTGGVVIEMNAKPQIGISLDPAAYARVLRDLGDGQWSIPVQLVVCESKSAVPSHHELSTVCGGAVGVSSPTGLWIGGQTLMAQAPDNGFEAARTLFMQKRVWSAACCLTLEELRRFGLPSLYFDRVILLDAPQSNELHASKWLQAREMVVRHTQSLMSMSDQKLAGVALKD